jgi:hypothetical protein
MLSFYGDELFPAISQIFEKKLGGAVHGLCIDYKNVDH